MSDPGSDLAAPPRTVVVVGGGITGLTAAYRLTRDHGVPRVIVLEAADYLGGKLLSTPFDGTDAVDAGADMFLTRVPWAVELCDELGIDTTLVAPATGTAFIAWGDRLHRLPEGLVLGVPTGLGALARTRLLSRRGKARAAIEPFVRRRDHGDCVGRLIRDRFGDEVAERLVDPLLGGINAGDADKLSLEASAPQLAAAARHRSLLLGLRRATGSPGQGPPFLAPRDGMGSLALALASHIDHIRINARVRSLKPRGTDPRRDGWTVTLDHEVFTADAVVLAVPAYAAAALLDGLAPVTAAGLRAIEYASVAMVTLAVKRQQVGAAADIAGVLVPKPQQRHMTAVSVASAKWPHLVRDRDDVVLRVSLGRYGNDTIVGRTDDELVACAVDECARIIGLTGSPSAVRVVRWIRAFPQYTPGHVDRVRAIRADVGRNVPGVWLAGAAYDGIGVPACIRQGNEAAAAIANLSSVV